MKKEILKEIREPGKSRKKKGQPKGRRNGFLEGLTGKDFTAAGLFFFSLLLCRLFVLQYGVFGSSIDWISQHSTSSRISHGIWEEVRIFTILPTTVC